MLKSSPMYLARTYGPVSDPYHFYCGALIPSVKQLSKMEQGSLLVVDLGDATLSDWLKFMHPNLKFEKIRADLIYPELIRRLQISVRIRRRAKTISPRNQDAYWKLNSNRFRRALNQTRKLAWERVPTAGEIDFKKVSIIVRKSSNDERERKGFIRDIPNIGELVEALRVRGITPRLIDPASTSPNTIVREISTSKVVVGQYGAGLFHQIWLRRGGATIEIHASQSMKFIPWIYEHLAAACGLGYVRCVAQDTWNGPVDAELVANSICEAAENCASQKWRFKVRIRLTELQLQMSPLLGLFRKAPQG